MLFLVQGVADSSTEPTPEFLQASRDTLEQLGEMQKSGKVKAGGAGKQHGMIKRSNKQIRNQRGTMVLAPGDAGLVRIHMPYSSKHN